MGPESALFLCEGFDLITCTITFIGVLYGITFTLYCLCAWSLYLKFQKPDTRRQARLSLAYISLLFCCATGVLALNARMVQLAYIDPADFPGGSFGYELSYNTTTISYGTTSSILNLIIEVLTMVILIWRLWIIWNGTRYAVAVTILPVLLLFSYIALDIPMSIVASLVPLDRLGISDRTGITMITTTYAILSGFTVLVAGLIAVRLLLVRRQHVKTIGMSEAASPYLSIVAILIESYILVALWSLAAAISFTSDSPSFYLFSSGSSTIKIFTYFLVVYRVETGRGWTKQTEEKLMSLQWNHGTQTATNGASGVRSQVPVTASVMAVDSLPVTHSHSAA